MFGSFMIGFRVITPMLLIAMVLSLVAEVVQAQQCNVQQSSVNSAAILQQQAQQQALASLLAQQAQPRAVATAVAAPPQRFLAVPSSSVAVTPPPQLQLQAPPVAQVPVALVPVSNKQRFRPLQNILGGRSVTTSTATTRTVTRGG